MRSIFIAMFCAVALYAQAPQTIRVGPQAIPTNAPPAAPLRPEDACTLEGKITNAASGEPIRKAGITLSPMLLAPTGGPPTAYSTSTDAEGKYAMKDIPPGQYRLGVQRNGFVSTQYGSRGQGRAGTTLTFTAGQKMLNINVKLPPHAVISGRITDEDGEPLANVSVSAMRYRFVTGRRQLLANNGASTNDLGEYRIFGIEPGRYYVSATYRGLMGGPNVQDRSASPKQDDGYARTLYPASADVQSAVQVEATLGITVQGINISLKRSPSVKVSGKVINQTGLRPAAGLRVYLLPNSAGSVEGLTTTLADPQGNFNISGVSPGSYALTGMLNEGNRSFSGRLQVEVGNSNIENAVVTIGLGYDVTGTLKVENTGGVVVDITTIRPFLRVANPSAVTLGGPSPATFKEDGSFTLNGVAPDLYYMNLQPMLPGHFIKSVRMGDQDGLDTPLDFSSGPGGPITIVLSTNGAEVSGTVTNGDSKPASATVALIPDSPKRREQMIWYKTASTDQSGRYNIKGVPPGKYKVLAWEDIESGAWMDPDVLQPVESKAKSIDVKEGARETVDLKVIPAE